jgi:hypothetical protein
MPVTIEIEIACESHEQARDLTERVQNGNHWIVQKHGRWTFLCACTPDEILHLGSELYYELAD